MNRSGTRYLGVMLLGIAMLAGTAQAGTVLTLSDMSSDETSPDVLDATLLFTVSGSQLILMATNDTPVVGGFDIDAVYFNSTSNVDDLVLTTAPTGWSMERALTADGFGRFDYALMSVSGNDPDDIAPGDSLTFTFDIVAGGPCVETDFTADFSQIPPGEHPVLAAAKFMNGPNGDSAFGAVTPEPHTALLILMGMGLLSRRRRRRS